MGAKGAQLTRKRGEQLPTFLPKLVITQKSFGWDSLKGLVSKPFIDLRWSSAPVTGADEGPVSLSGVAAGKNRRR